MKKTLETPFLLNGVFEFETLTVLGDDEHYLVAASSNPPYLKASSDVKSEVIIPAGEIIYEQGSHKRVLNLGPQEEYGKPVKLELALELEYLGGRSDNWPEQTPSNVYLKALERVMNGINEYWQTGYEAPHARFVGVHDGYETDFRLDEIIPHDFMKLERLVANAQKHGKDSLLFNVKRVIRAQSRTIHPVAG